MPKKLPRVVREADTADKKYQAVPMWTNKADAKVRLWPSGGTRPLPINTPVLRGQIIKKDFGEAAFCSFNPPLRGLFTAGWILLADLADAPVVVAPAPEA